MVVSRSQSKSLYFNSQYDNVRMMNTSNKNKWVTYPPLTCHECSYVILLASLETSPNHIGRWSPLAWLLEYIFQHFHNFKKSHYPSYIGTNTEHPLHSQQIIIEHLPVSNKDKFNSMFEASVSTKWTLFFKGHRNNNLLPFH